MPTYLPVPSKAALLTLRNLALGTSCTVAIGTGLITEDRRRRIHTARQIHDNAKKLKSSRCYHSTESGVIERFGDQGGRLREDAFWLPGSVVREFETSRMRATKAHDSYTDIPPGPLRPKEKDSETGYKPRVPKRAHRVPKRSLDTHRRIPINTRPKPISTHSKVRTEVESTVDESSNPHGDDRQHKLAREIMELLESNDGPDVNAAAACFCEGFGEDLLVRLKGPDKLLIDAALKLTTTATSQNQAKIPEMVLDILARNCPIYEEDFFKFQPDEVLRGLLARDLDSEHLKKAFSIYLMKLKKKPRVKSEEMSDIGAILCVAATEIQDYKLTLRLFERLKHYGPDVPAKAVAPIIEAAHALEEHDKVFRFFEELYTLTSPRQKELYDIGDIVFKTMVKLGSFEKGEELLFVVSRMAETQGLVTSTTWVLEVLGHDWRTHRSISRTEALFQRIDPLLKFIKYPQAVYGAMIQFCIEAKREDTAMLYYGDLRKFHAPGPEDLRIYGHFAYAKALRQDWDGVRDDVFKMKAVSARLGREVDASFGPIFQEFSQTHTLVETEAFIRFYSDECGIKITTPIFTTMANAYCTAMEAESLLLWIQYASSSNRQIDANLVNPIIKGCFFNFGFSFKMIYEFARGIRKLPRANLFTNQETINLLYRFAAARNPSPQELSHRLSQIQEWEISFSRLDSNLLYRHMIAALNNCSPDFILQIYRGGCEREVRMKSRHLVLVTNASMELYPHDMSKTTDLLLDAQKRDQDISMAVANMVFNQMNTLFAENVPSSQIISIAQDTIAALEKDGGHIPPSVVTHTMSLLERGGHFRPAIEFWEAMFHVPLSTLARSDNATLNVLLKAYVGLQSAKGVRWVIKMFSVTNLVPDKRFHTCLKHVRNEARTYTQKIRLSYKFADFMTALEEGCGHVRNLRASLESDRERIQQKTIEIIANAIKEESGFQKDDNDQSDEGIADMDNDYDDSSVADDEEPEFWVDSEDEMETETDAADVRGVVAAAV